MPSEAASATWVQTTIRGQIEEGKATEIWLCEQSWVSEWKILQSQLSLHAEAYDPRS